MKYWAACGRIAFWLGWPFLWLYLYNTQRTRVLVRADDRILVIKNWLGDGKWALPGGGLHHHEAPLLGAVRELSEETGLQVTTAQLEVLGEILIAKDGFRAQYQGFTVTVPAAEELRKQRWEIIDAAWMPVDQLTITNSGRDVLALLAAVG